MTQPTTAELATTAVTLFEVADMPGNSENLDRVIYALTTLERLSRNDQVGNAEDARFQIFAILQAANILHSPADPAARDEALAEIRAAGVALIRFIEKLSGAERNVILENYYLTAVEAKECHDRAYA